MEAKKRGGVRPGAGAKKKYNENTVVVGFAVPISRVKEFRIFGYQKLKEYELLK